MAIAHPCLNCGRDLARQRPQREPHYNLRLIICPCGRATTRRLHPIWRNWRWFARFASAMLAMILQALMALLLLPLTSAAAFSLARAWQRYDVATILEDHRPMVAWSLIVVPVVTGTWLRAAFNHWRFGLQWFAWFGFYVVLLTYFHLLERILDGHRPPTQEDVRNWRDMVCAFGIMMVVSTAGMPVGRAIVASHARRRRERWRKRKRRWRARGLST